MSAIIRIAACSYEGSLFGWDVCEENANFEGVTVSKNNFAVPKELASKIKMVFGFHVSTGSFKAIAVSASGKFLAVGGMDERIHIFNVVENKAVGEISGHIGAITSLMFYGDNYLISSSEDHTLFIWRVYDWQHLHILGGHKDTVLGFAVHPSGKIALSISKDHTMKLWNLVQGRCSFTRRLRGTADYIFWHPNGDYYMLVTSSELQMFAVADNSCAFEVKSRSKINHATFMKISDSGGADDYRIVYICENQTLNIVDMVGTTTANLQLSSIGAGRLRTVCTCPSEGLPKIDFAQDNLSLTSDCLVLATSTGCIAVLNGYMLEQKNSETAASKMEESEAVFGQALYAFDQVRADPRFTGVVAWNQMVQVGSRSQGESTSISVIHSDKEGQVHTNGGNIKLHPIKAEKKKVKFEKQEPEISEGKKRHKKN